MFNEFMDAMKKHRDDKDIPIEFPAMKLKRNSPAIDGTQNGNQSAGGFYDPGRLKYYKNYFKQLYKTTNEDKYKKYYKLFKNMIDTN